MKVTIEPVQRSDVGAKDVEVMSDVSSLSVSSLEDFDLSKVELAHESDEDVMVEDRADLNVPEKLDITLGPSETLEPAGKVLSLIDGSVVVQVSRR